MVFAFLLGYIIMVLVFYRMMEHFTGVVHQFTCLMDQHAGIVGDFMDRTHMHGIGALELAVVMAVLALSLSR